MFCRLSIELLSFEGGSGPAPTKGRNHVQAFISPGKWLRIGCPEASNKSEQSKVGRMARVPSPLRLLGKLGEKSPGSRQRDLLLPPQGHDLDQVPFRELLHVSADQLWGHLDRLAESALLKAQRSSPWPNESLQDSKLWALDPI